MAKSTTDLILYSLLGLAVVGLLFVVKDSFEQRVVQQGEAAPSFSVRTESGREVSTSSFGGKVLVVNFWATWCPPCIEETPSLNQFAAQMKDSGVVVLGISIDKNQQNYKRFLQQVKPAFETSNDPGADIAAKYGTFKWPESYVIDTKGTVVAKYIGAVNWTDPALIQQFRGWL